MNRKTKRKKLLSIFASALLITSSLSPAIGGLVGTAYAVESPSSPSQPSAPSVPEEPTLSEQPNSPTQPDQPDQPVQPDQTGDAQVTDSTTQDQSTSTTDSSGSGQDQTEGSTTDSQPVVTSTGGSNSDDNVGGTEIQTGDANAVGEINTNVNTNIALTDSTGGLPGDTVLNSGNGSDSINNTNLDNSSSTVIDQGNSAVIINKANLEADSGHNSAKDNTNGDVVIQTGDANTALTIVNQANTNIAADSVVEFNIVDDHLGDIILDFENPCANQACVAGTPVYAGNIDNASNTQNSVDSTTSETSATFQQNDAEIENMVILSSNSGSNKARDNTAGDVLIETGDANVSANVVNFANNNFADNVILAVVNIFGDLIGDLIVPDQGAKGSSESYLANQGNGSDSANFISADSNVYDQVTQENTANIINNLDITASTGGNRAKDNTGGDNVMETGDVGVVAQILNIANTNIVGGDWWLVLVNEAGNWIGKIMGADENANFAGSAGTEFVVNPDGSITATNKGNASGSQNTISQNNQTSNTVAQQNTANIVNNLQLSANTGNNLAKDNTGGDTSIKTGDATVVANIINFVNNNIAGNGRIFVTIVNVFGSWLGDFVGPDYTLENEALAVVDTNSEQGIGGISDIEGNSDNSQSGLGGTGGGDAGSSGSSDSSGSDSGGTGPLGSGSSLEIISSTLAFGVNKTDSLDNIEDGAGMVLGASSDNGVETAGNRVIKINLAWLIFLLPPLAILVIRKRRKALLKAKAD